MKKVFNIAIGFLVGLGVIGVQPANAQLTNTEWRFIDAMAFGLRSVGDYSMAGHYERNPQQAVINGYWSCRMFTQGWTPTGLANTSSSAGSSRITLATALAASITLCPEYSHFVSPQPTYTPVTPQRGTQISSSCTYLLAPDTNIRSGASTTSSVIGNESTLLSDRRIIVHSTERGTDGFDWSWIGFSGSDGRTAGWVQTRFVQTNTCR